MYMTNLLLVFSEDRRKLRKRPREKGGAGQEEGDPDDEIRKASVRMSVCLSLLTCLVVSVCEIAVRFTPIRPSIQINHAN